MKNCIITGVGGQGTVLLSRLIGDAALAEGLSVRGSETIGMAQRGGSVVSHVRMGREIFSPLIGPGQADVVIAFEPAEAVRVLPLMSPAGTMVVLDRAVRPVAGMLDKDAYRGEDMIAYLRENAANLIVISYQALLEQCHEKAVNVAMLGAAAQAGLLPFSLEKVRDALLKRIPEKFHAMNLQALQVGAGMIG